DLFLLCLVGGDCNELIMRAQIECLSSPGVCCCVHLRSSVRNPSCPSRDVCQAQNVSIAGSLDSMNCPGGQRPQEVKRPRIISEQVLFNCARIRNLCHCLSIAKVPVDEAGVLP